MQTERPIKRVSPNPKLVDNAPCKVCFWQPRVRRRKWFEGERVTSMRDVLLASLKTPRRDTPLYRTFLVTPPNHKFRFLLQTSQRVGQELKPTFTITTFFHAHSHSLHHSSPPSLLIVQLFFVTQNSFFPQAMSLNWPIRVVKDYFELPRAA